MDRGLGLGTNAHPSCLRLRSSLPLEALGIGRLPDHPALCMDTAEWIVTGRLLRSPIGRVPRARQEQEWMSG